MATAADKIERYDTIVIGTGQGGKPLAVAPARVGWKTAIIEREHMRDICIKCGLYAHKDACDQY